MMWQRDLRSSLSSSVINLRRSIKSASNELISTGLSSENKSPTEIPKASAIFLREETVGSTLPLSKWTYYAWEIS